MDLFYDIYEIIFCLWSILLKIFIYICAVFKKKERKGYCELTMKKSFLVPNSYFDNMLILYLY